MTLEQYNKWEEFRKKEGNLNGVEVKMINQYYADVFKKKYKKYCTCNKKIYQNMINKLNTHFESIERPKE